MYTYSRIRAYCLVLHCPTTNVQVNTVVFRKSQTSHLGVNHRLVISSVPESRNTNRGQNGFHQES